MPPLPMSRQLAAMEMRQHQDGAPGIYDDDEDYCREVLLLASGLTEALLEESLVREAQELGITVPRPSTADDDRKVGSTRESTNTVVSNHVRTPSSGSHDSVSTGLTSRSSGDLSDHSMATTPLYAKKRALARRSLSFSEYEKYLDESIKLGLRKAVTHIPIPAEPAPSLFSVSTRTSYHSIKSHFKTRFKMRRTSSFTQEPIACICCRNDFRKSNSLHKLLCGHSYCDACLRILMNQASTDESKMPPRCCSQPISGSIVKEVLTKEEQYEFMQSVLQFSTPWESRIFCPNPGCGDFIPKRKKIDPRHPFEVVCRKCRTRACSTCKRAAHALGQDCPSDWELEAVLRMGEKSGWRRCYKCRMLVELSQGCSHITCRCKAQFCYICGAVWDPTVGCPNYCNGEEELERRRREEEARLATEEAEKAAREEAERLAASAKQEAEKRTRESDELNNLRARQISERDRFAFFERRSKWALLSRQSKARIFTMHRYDELIEKMKERHAKTSSHLEDRQVAAEMELRATLKQTERSVRIRLRHMEAYCDGLGRAASGTNPSRMVTERDLRELGRQYNVRDDMDRLHRSKINVLRDKQAREMEQLIARQEQELNRLMMRQAEELDMVEERFPIEEENLAKIMTERRKAMKRRWVLAECIARARLEKTLGVVFAPMSPVEWPSDEAKLDEELEAVTE